MNRRKWLPSGKMRSHPFFSRTSTNWWNISGFRLIWLKPSRKRNTGRNRRERRNQSANGMLKRDPLERVYGPLGERAARIMVSRIPFWWFPAMIAGPSVAMGA